MRSTEAINAPAASQNLKSPTRRTHANIRVHQPHGMLTLRGTKIFCWRFGSHRIALTALRLSAVLRVSIRPARGSLARRCEPATLTHFAHRGKQPAGTSGTGRPPRNRGRRTPTAEP
jgi:hypothetical protein